jgi:hypothetical protein
MAEDIAAEGIAAGDIAAIHLLLAEPQIAQKDNQPSSGKQVIDEIQNKSDHDRPHTGTVVSIVLHIR